MSRRGARFGRRPGRSAGPARTAPTDAQVWFPIR